MSEKWVGMIGVAIAVFVWADVSRKKGNAGPSLINTVGTAYADTVRVLQGRNIGASSSTPGYQRTGTNGGWA